MPCNAGPAFPPRSRFILQSLIVLMMLASDIFRRYRVNADMNFHRLMTSAFFATWLAASLRLSGPVLLAALGETFAECSGVLNVGIEGTILLGALASFLTDYVTGMAVDESAGGSLTGIVFNLLLAWMTLPSERARWWWARC